MEKYKVILVDDEIEAIQAMEHKMDNQWSESPGTGRKYTAGCCDHRYKNALYEWPGTGAEVK